MGGHTESIYHRRNRRLEGSRGSAVKLTMLQANEAADNEDGTVKKRSVASDQELIPAHERKIRAWTQFIHTAITSELQNKQHVDADDCLVSARHSFGRSVDDARD